MKISNKNYLDQLNDRQSEAITHLDGPCLIVAGAGSGKTRVLTSRVVEIIKKKIGAFPSAAFKQYKAVPTNTLLTMMN